MSENPKRRSRRSVLQFLGRGIIGGMVFAECVGIDQLCDGPRAWGTSQQKPDSKSQAAGDYSSFGKQAAEALRKAIRFFATEVAREGGYVWTYSADLRFRQGEGRASETTVWVQPPGTPAVGAAILRAYERTGEEEYLEAARKAGECLARGQLESGGWTYRIEFSLDARRRFFYRTPPRNEKGFNWSTLDDDTTQSALRFLMELDRVLGFGNELIHECVQYGLTRLLAVQYPCGAWPQGFREPPDPTAYPVLGATYPEEIPPAPNFKEYWRFYTLNDQAHMDTIRMLLLAAKIYGEPKYQKAAEKGGEFLLLAQMPDPQPAWAQQYNFQMQPAWARRFELPAIAGGESQDVLRVLMTLYQHTGREDFLAPIPRAVGYLKSSVLPDGRLARFYELKTNRPLYFTRDYRLTHDDQDLPTHYAFKVENCLPEIEVQYQRLRERQQPQSLRETPGPHLPPRPSLSAVERVIKTLDDRGRWVEKGRMETAGQSVGQVIRSQTFIANVDILSAYLAWLRSA